MLLSNGNAVDVNSTFLRSHLVVEVAEEAESQQAVDAQALGKIADLHDARKLRPGARIRPVKK